VDTPEARHVGISIGFGVRIPNPRKNVGSFNAKHPRNPKGSHLGGKFRRK
jgi:hypothetical protein